MSFGRRRACQLPEADWIPLAYVAAAPDGVRVMVAGKLGYQPPAGVSSPGFSKSFVQVLLGAGSAICMTGGGDAPVGVSVRSQAPPRYAIAGNVRTATVLRSVCIGLLLEAPRAMQPTGTALRTKAKHVPVLARRVARRDRSTRADGAAFGKPNKWRCWREKPRSPLVRVKDGALRRARDPASRVWCGGKTYGANTMVPPPESQRPLARSCHCADQ